MSAAEDPRLSLIELAKRSAVVAGVALLALGLAAFFWTVSEALLVLFATILFAVLLDGLTQLLVRNLHFPHGLALTLVLLVMVACVGGFFVGGADRIASEAPQLRRSMRQSIQRVERRVHSVRATVSQMKRGMLTGSGDKTATGPSSTPPSGQSFDIFTHLRRYVSTSVSIVVDAFIVLVAGIFFAIHPHFYIDTPIKLVPQHRRARLLEARADIAHALRRWLLGRFVSMIAVGLVTGIGLTVLGVQLAGLLAVIATVLTFIPYLGAILSFIPAVLVALLSGPWMVIYVILLYLGAHVLEGYIVTPLIQSRTVHLAPGWLILSQLAGGLAAGIFGVLIAAPLLVTLAILVQTLYVEDVLGDRVHVLGSQDDEDADTS